MRNTKCWLKVPKERDNLSDLDKVDRISVSKPDFIEIVCGCSSPGI